MCVDAKRRLPRGCFRPSHQRTAAGEERLRSLHPLQADEEGVALAVDLLRDATRVLSDSGLLMLEVGESVEALERRLPKVPFTWIDLPGGSAGVAAVSAQELRDWSAAGLL